MSTPKRFFIDKIEDGRAVLEGEEFSHAVTVLRVSEGAEIVLLDNGGREYTAVVDKVEKRRLLAHITGSTLSDKEPKAEIYLLCGFLKNADKNEMIVQKAVELGAKRIAFFGSEFGSAHMNENKLERLNRVSKEAAKQCLRAIAPEVTYFGDLKSALLSAENYKNKLFACEFIEKSQTSWDISGSAALVVGSEGGFSKEEYALAQSMGFSGISLGKRILRAETAAIAVCVLAAAALGELE